MRSLFLSEWERLWKRKITWIFLIAIPLIIAATVKYYLVHNKQLQPSSPEYTWAQSFPVMAMIEQLIVVFNVLSLVLLTMTFTEEYRSGQIRMVMLRSYTAGQLFRAKCLVYTAVMALFFITYLLVSIGAGYLFFEPHEHLMLFYHDTPVPSGEVIGYTILYYGLAFITIIGTGSVFLAIAICSRTTTGAVGIGMGYLLCSLAYPIIFQLTNKIAGLGLPGGLRYLSLTEIQYSGIAVMLSDTLAIDPVLSTMILLLISAGYIVIFMGAALLTFLKSDRWI